MRIGTVCYATRQGLGTLAKSFYDGGLVTDVAIFRHSKYQTMSHWYPPDTLELVNLPFNGPKVDAWLAQLDWVLFFETPWDFTFPNYCRARGKKTAIVPMYEWWRTDQDSRHRYDKILAPSVLDQALIPGSVFLQIPVSGQTWHQRTTAQRFLHNAGHIGFHEHKGTRQILQAMRLVQKSVNMTVRCQPEAGPSFQKMCDDEGYSREVTMMPETGATVTLKVGEFAGPGLYGPEFDVFVMAEKYNGLSLPLAEARASGMLVVTSDRHPMNTWLPREPLIPVAGYYRSRVGPPYLEFDEARVDPVDIAAKLDSLYGADISEYSQGGKAWAEANSWGKLLPAWREEFGR